MTLDPKLLAPPSAIQEHIGYSLVEWREDYCKIHLPLQPQLLNRQGIPHGGIYAMLLDTAMGYAGCFSGDGNVQILALTINMSVNFVGQPKGTLLIADGWKTGGGRKTYFAEAKLHDDTGLLVATSTGVFRYRTSG